LHLLCWLVQTGKRSFVPRHAITGRTRHTHTLWTIADRTTVHPILILFFCLITLRANLQQTVGYTPPPPPRMLHGNRHILALASEALIVPTLYQSRKFTPSFLSDMFPMYLKLISFVWKRALFLVSTGHALWWETGVKHITTKHKFRRGVLIFSRSEKCMCEKHLKGQLTT